MYWKEGRSFANLTHNYKTSHHEGPCGQEEQQRFDQEPGEKGLAEHEVYQRRCEAFPRRERILGIRWYLHAFFEQKTDSLSAPYVAVEWKCLLLSS